MAAAAAVCAAAVVAGVAGGVALAQVGGPNPQTVSELAKVCVSNAYCQGLAPGAGGCAPHGALPCGDTGCQANSGCQWQVVWSCNNQPNSTCYLIYQQPSIASGCVGTCTWISYNMCACMCTDDPNGSSAWTQATDCQ